MRIILYVVLFAITSAIHAAPPGEREEEIRNEMWLSSDNAFKVIETPKKWNDQSAVVIAQLNRFEYRKPVMRSQILYNDYKHYRIKLFDKKAVAEYSEISYMSGYKVGAWEDVKVYVGFKVIKPDGKEIIIDASKAVKMEREYRGAKRAYNKLAIPNLEPGDIIDYYICEENIKTISGIMHFFDPVIFTLAQEYPVMSHKIQFRVERKCYINLRSLNGAPELNLTIDEANEEKYYSLEGTDIEGVEKTRWIFPYRELPTIKFRAAYASGKAIRNYDVLLGEPGELKSAVSKEEVQKMVISMLSSIRTDMSAASSKAMLSTYTKRKLKNVSDPFDFATKVYYYYRFLGVNAAEVEAVEGGNPWSTTSRLEFVYAFSAALKARKIAHDIVLGIPRNINSLNDLLIENEIEWLVRVKKGKESMYFSPFDLNTMPGSIDKLLEGTQAYALDGLNLEHPVATITLPATTETENETNTHIKVDLTDPAKAKLTIKRSMKGNNKTPDQYYWMDPFDFRAEEAQIDELAEPRPNKKYPTMKEAYLAKRNKNLEERLKTHIAQDFDLKIDSLSYFRIEQTGRYLTAPVFVYRFDLMTANLATKVGPNYLVDAGKLIEQQVKVGPDEMDRKHNIYYDNARSYKFVIEITVPKGYEVQGLENFNKKVENQTGGFASAARLVDGKIIIETTKHYGANYVPASEWKNIVAFLNEASSFNEQKILLKKI